MLNLAKTNYTCNKKPLGTKVNLKLKEISSSLKSLEINYISSQKGDRLLIMALRMKSMQNDSLEMQLEEALKENKQILDMIQLRNEDGDMSRACSKSNLGSSISTVSMVHLQYKYEELLANHRGLLKILELRNNEVKKYLNENHELHEKIQKLNFDLGSVEDKVEFLKRKIAETKRRKHEKVEKLKVERQTLSLIHCRLVALLHRQCMEKNYFIESILKTTSRSEKGLLLQEIKKNNILTHENFQLQQELQYLKSLFCISRSTSKETLITDLTSNGK